MLGPGWQAGPGPGVLHTSVLLYSRRGPPGTMVTILDTKYIPYLPGKLWSEKQFSFLGLIGTLKTSLGDFLMLAVTLSNSSLTLVAWEGVY